MKIYFAGKVTKNGWRQEILNLRNLIDGEQPITHYRETGIFMEKGLIYNGPYVVGCDHGCYHGPQTHGVGAGKDDLFCYTDEYSLSREALHQFCLDLIVESDAMFCYIDDLTAFGTFAEVGYAKAKGIPVYAYLSDQLTGSQRADLWFVLEGAVVQEVVPSAKVAYEQFKSLVLKSEPVFNEETADEREPLTEGQENYLKGLIPNTQELLNFLTDERYNTSEIDIETNLAELSKREGIKCIGILKEFNDEFSAFKTLMRQKKTKTTQTDALHLAERLPAKEFTHLFSVKRLSQLQAVQEKIEALQGYQLDVLFNLFEKHRQRLNPLKTRELLDKGKPNSFIPEPKKDARVRTRNRANETFHPFTYLSDKDRRLLVKNIGEFVAHYVVKQDRVLSTPAQLNRLDRHELAQTFLKGPYQSKRLSLEEVENQDLLAYEVARFIDESIPRAYAKYYLNLDLSPASYEVDAAGFKLTYQLKG